MTHQARRSPHTKFLGAQGEKGLAMLETIPLLVIFVVLLSFSMGFFGVVHTAILHSIAARTAAFESFRQRTNLYYYREDGSGADITTITTFHRKGFRYHAVQHPSDPRHVFVATTRPIGLGRSIATAQADGDVHNKEIRELTARNTTISISPVWVMVGYGLCLNAQCGN